VYKRQIYQIAESNRIETFFARIGMLYWRHSGEYGYWNVSYTSIVLWVETIRLQYLVRRGAGCRAVLVCVTNGITSRYISQLGN